MAQKKGQRSCSEDPDELARIPLQALLLADSFAQKFRPITLERPKVLLPLANVPMIEYTLTWLESVGVEEVFVFCCAHAKQVKDYLAKSQWTKQGPGFTVKPVESNDATSAGDALRTIYNQGLMRGDFVLISGDTVSNMSLAQALQEHKERRKKDPLAIMTMVIKKSKFSSFTKQSRLGNDEILMAIHPETKELLYYEDKADPSQQFTSLDRMLLSENPALSLFNDMQDCYIDICSPEVLSLFADNFDYQYLRRHFVKGLLVDDIMGYRIFTHEIHSSYAARIDNFRSYDTISKDIIQRWTYPLVPDVMYFENCSRMKLDRRGIYQAPDVNKLRSANIGEFSLIGSGTTIGDHTVISTSVIGQGCSIGCNVSIQGCYVWDNVIIEDNCKLSHALVCDAVHLRAGVILEPGVILSFKVEVGQQSIVPGYSKVSLLPQPSKQDSDEELEYVEANSASMGSPSLSSTFTARNVDFTSGSDMENFVPPEVAFSGTGYLWSVCEDGHEEEWRYSIAPMPLNKLVDSVNSHADPVAPDNDEGDILVSGGLPPDSDSTVSGDGEVDFIDSTDFEKEVEATFQRALEGVNEYNVILEINSLRLSYNMSHADCAGALFYSIMKSASADSHHSNMELCKNAKAAIIKWQNLLKHYLISVDEEIEVILKFEDMSLESEEEFSPLFSEILHHLYDKDILSEDAILSWAQEKEAADESDKIFLKQSEAFITWLKEASEEEDEDED